MVTRLKCIAALLFCTLAACSLRADPGAGLHFDGVDDYVTVTNGPGLDPYPLTITAWVRTLHNANTYEPIIKKYLPGSLNGYSLHILNGHLYAWYFRDNLNYVYNGDTSLDGGAIADGHWHHVAFVVSQTGGALYVDGNIRTNLAWTGTPGAASTTDPIYIGKYSLTAAPYTNTLLGDLDEISLWNRALTSSELNYLKFRRLSGREDGLVANWHFDEGAGTVTSNSVSPSFSGTLVNGPQWVPSQTAVVLNPIATNCLKFDGVNGFVQVPHNSDLNAYPLTASAWFRTTNTTLFQGIVSKYRDASADGWSLDIAGGGFLRGFYYRQGSNKVIDATSAAFVADGAWHHAALTVDASGGKLWLDGVQVGSGTWQYSPGPPTTGAMEPLQIGRYYNYPDRFLGAIDEVTVWSRALTAGEFQTNRNLLLVGTEPNLVAYWRLDEGSGTNIFDSTSFGHTGNLISNPAWTGSTAYLGDGSTHLVVSPGIPNFLRTYAINTAQGIIPALGENFFQLHGIAFLRRFNDFGPTPPSLPVTNLLDGGLQVSGPSTPVPVIPNTVTNGFVMTSFTASLPQPTVFGGVASVSSTISVTPNSANLDSVNNQYDGLVTISHTENGGSPSSDGIGNSGATRLLHFNGHLFFGKVDTVISNVLNTPTPLSFNTPSYLTSSLQLSGNGAYFAAAPAVQFGGGGLFNITLGVDGTATNLNGSFSFAGPNQFFQTAGIRYQMPGLSLNNSGLIATNFLLWFPSGFGMAISTNTRSMLPYASKTNVTIGPDLLPTNSILSFKATDYQTNLLYFAEETKPFFIIAPQIDWHIAQGELYISQAQNIQFVRQKEDGDLDVYRPFLTNQLAADRISNDEYFNNAVPVPATPVYIRPDPNGAAWLTMQIGLQENEYRPHFPYMNRNIGDHIPMIGGALSISNDLVDTANSYLLLASNAPIPYARDCGLDGACTSFATNGPQVLQFVASPGHLGLGELKFTPDGGLLAYGALIAPTNLTWGYIGGTSYAERTSDVQTGALEIAGTFLRGDQTTLPDAQKPAGILFTGWGDDINPSYVERPDMLIYTNGFANYAGLNFRAPAQGRSFIAGQDTDWYPLTVRSKYYTRFGGVSGIHESASFPNSNLTLYGYAFSFATYRLSYLDSANWESRTDGQVALGGPSQFNVEFQRMKFLCRGNLDSAQLPPTIGTKHMVYWNTDIQPLSLQFEPQSSDPCSLSTRYLVLGVETKLPYIPQALHASLGFKPNGNLVTAATGVANGIDSRFAVPVNLKLQGPGTSTFPLATAGDGYFNNWETSGKPDAGFFSLAGRMRVPFFRDVKVQLHVTPSGANTGRIDIMGGWAAEQGLGQDRGWSVAGQNYFTQSKFDPNADGWPTSVSLASYRKSPDETYRPRAQQNWIDVAGFDYPLAWNGVLREFQGFSPATVTLPVIDVDSNLKELSPGKVDFDFAQDLNLKLPHIKVLDLANDALNELNAPIITLSNAIRSELGSALNSAGLTTGFRSLQNMLQQNTDQFFRPVLDSTLNANQVVDKLYAALSAQLAVNKTSLLSQSANIVNASSNGLQNAIQSMNGAVGNVNSVFGKLDGTLQDVDDTLGLFLRVLEKDGSGNRHVVRIIIEKLVQDQGPALGIVANLSDSVVNDLLTDLEPTLAQIEAQLRDLRQQFAQVREQLGHVTLDNDFNESLDLANHQASLIQNYMQQASYAVSNLLEAAVSSSNDYFTSDPQRAKNEIEDRLIVAFLSSTVDSKYQETFRQFFSDKDFLLDQIMSVLFDQINRSIRNGIEQQAGIAGAQDGIFQNLKGAGLLSQSLASAKIRGSPKFTGDSLDSIHLDSDIRVNLPDEMKFSAYMDIVRLKSATTPVGCIPPGAPAAEVTLGANDIPLDWSGVNPSDGKKMTLSLAARWILQSGAVKGIGGSLDIKGSAGFKGCNMSEIKAALAIGSVENYFAGQAKATVIVLGIPVDFRAGFFAGHACSLDALHFVDPEADQVLQQPGEFSGVYLEYGGGLSLSDLLLGESSDLLDVRADITTALFYQGGPRFGRIGGRQKVSVDIKLLYVLEGGAKWAVFVVLDSAGQLTVGGSAEVCGRIGICPICEEGCKSVQIKGVINDGGIDYFIDY